MSKAMTAEQLRQQKIRALKKERAANNARVKKELMTLGETYQDRKPPKQPMPATVGEDLFLGVTNEQREQLLKIEKQLQERLSHVQTVIHQQANPGATPMQHIAVMPNGHPTETEVAKARQEIHQLADMLNVIYNFIAKSQPNPQAPSAMPVINKLAHVEAVACCNARSPWNAMQHQFVPTQPAVQVIGDQVSGQEVDRVRDEIQDVKEFLHNSIGALSSNMNSLYLGKIYGALGGTTAPPPQTIIHPQPQVILPQQPQTASAASQQPPQPAQPASSGLADMLAQMSSKLDGLAEDMRG